MRLDARFYIPTCTFTIHHYDLRSKKQIPSKWLLLSWTFFSLTFEISSPLPHQDQFPSLFLRPNYVEHEHGAAIAGRAKYFCNLINFRGLPFLHEWHFLSLNRPLSLHCPSFLTRDISDVSSVFAHTFEVLVSWEDPQQRHKDSHDENSALSLRLHLFLPHNYRRYSLEHPQCNKSYKIKRILFYKFFNENGCLKKGGGGEILAGSEDQQNSTQSLRHNVHTWWVLVVCSIHFLFAMFAFFIYSVHFFICSIQFFSLQRFLFIRSDRLLFAAITFLFAAIFFILSVHCFSLIIFKLSFLSLQFIVFIL